MDLEIGRVGLGATSEFLFLLTELADIALRRLESLLFWCIFICLF